MKIVTVREMRDIEQAAVVHGVSLDELQQNAAAAIARYVRRHAGPYLFLVGPGNNGRDALIAAAIVVETGGHARAYLAPGVASEDAQGRLTGAGGEIATYEGDESLVRLREWTARSSLVVDGLLGIGIHGPVREPMATIISALDEECRARRKPVVAVDLPSGIDADTGEVPGPAVHATETLSLGCVKTGLLIPPAAGHVGRLEPLDIGLPADTYRGIRRELTSPAGVASLLPPRPLDAHKGTFGRVLVVAGSPNFVGAPYLVGAAAARSGCGIVTLAVPEWQRFPLAALLPEATYLPLRENVDSKSAAANASAIKEVLPDCQALAIGPGLGQGDAQTRLVLAVLEAARDVDGIRVVVDADALNALSPVPDWWERIGASHILTPHPGEMSRLVGLPVSEVNRSRLSIAIEAAVKWGQVVVLKGAYTAIASPDGSLWVNPAAIPALATGGSGDVLAGIVAGLLAQGLGPAEAARAGVFVHSECARRVLTSGGPAAPLDRLLASDLIPQIPWVLANPLGGDLKHT